MAHSLVNRNDSARPIFWPVGQLLTVQLRQSASALAFALTAAIVSGCSTSESGRDPNVTAAGAAAGPQGVANGGQLVVSVRTEPQSFNRYARRDSPTDLISLLLNAKLVRVNRVSQEVEPWLAESWTRSEAGDHAGKRYTVKLRPDVTFSDGHPFTADDVVFSLEAVYDARRRQRAGRRADGVGREADREGGRRPHARHRFPRGVRARAAPFRQPADSAEAQAGAGAAAPAPSARRGASARRSATSPASAPSS